MTISYLKLIAWTLDLLAPSRCAGCGDAGSDLCSRCCKAIAESRSIVRPRSNGAPGATALGAYEGVLRSAILALKFRGTRTVGARLGRRLAPRIAWPYESIVPVPLHGERLRERGYNQAAEIAHGIELHSGVAQVERALARVRATQPQTMLGLAARHANVRDAFSAGPDAGRVRGRRVLLVDDVITTGATGCACSAALLSLGAREVYFAALAVRL
jgi:ComF family protein